MSATRAFTLRSALRAATRTQIPRSTGRKGYASVRDAAQDAAQSAQKAAHGAQQAAHGAFQKSSDLPWYVPPSGTHNAPFNGHTVERSSSIIVTGEY